MTYKLVKSLFFYIFFFVWASLVIWAMIKNRQKRHMYERKHGYSIQKFRNLNYSFMGLFFLLMICVGCFIMGFTKVETRGFRESPSEYYYTAPI